MMTENMRISEAELDSSLDRLEAPVPSDILRRRVVAMTPQPAYRPMLQRFAAAAVLALSIAAAATLQTAGPVGTTVAIAPGPGVEISAGDIALVDGPDRTERPEPYSIAGLPIE